MEKAQKCKIQETEVKELIILRKEIEELETSRPINNELSYITRNSKNMGESKKAVKK